MKKLMFVTMALAVVMGCSRNQLEEPTPAFVIESGPEIIGWSRAWVIKHKETGRRFILTESPQGGTDMEPLL